MVLAQPQPQNQHAMQAFGLTRKVTVVTGGARGIGFEVSRALAEAGAYVALIYNSSKTADAIAADIASANNVRAASPNATPRKPLKDLRLRHERYQKTAHHHAILSQNWPGFFLSN